MKAVNCVTPRLTFPHSCNERLLLDGQLVLVVFDFGRDFEVGAHGGDLEEQHLVERH